MNRKIAIPTTNGILSAHFGHCEKFAIYEVDNNQIVKENFVSPPPHEPGSHPAFLRNLGCNTIIAGGMGVKAQQLFQQNNIEVIIGLQSDNLKGLVEAYISDELESKDNLCDH
jgi:predicted Fe-Mo cluster-binding NifX family protein